jgi:alpha-1,2-glucosyltransferase
LRITVRQVATLIVAVLSAILAIVVLQLQIRSGPGEQSIGIRWAADTSELARLTAERRLRLRDGEATGSDTWVYRVQDHSRAAIRDIVGHPLVADTSHIDRVEFRIRIDRPTVPLAVRRLLEADLGVAASFGLALVALGGFWSARRELALGVRTIGALPGIELGTSLSLLAIGFVFFADNGHGVDENIHYDQILRFSRGEWTLTPTLTTIPGFHALVAALAWPAGGPSQLSVRVIVFLLSVATVATFYTLARALEPDNAGTRTLQFTLLPILFPQFFLVYTDVASLLFVLLMMHLAVRRHDWSAGAIGLVACLIRQNNVIWVAFVMVWSHVRDHGWTWQTLTALLTRYWTFIVTGLTFLLFVIANDGQAALGDDAGSHPLGTVHFTNVFFLLFLSCFMFLPLWWGYRAAMMAALRRWWTWGALICLLPIFWWGFVNDHPHNNERADYFLPNALLIYFSSTPLRKLVFLVPVAIAGLGMTSAPMKTPWWLVLPFSVLFLLPEWLVVPRYYIIPIAVFLVVREHASPASERLQTLLCLAMGGAAFVIMERALGWI